ncbi:MAG: MBL fold metallo-hydrolase [Planctomycetota bacterium]|jgi:ribonuclease BN (tRNA processing enzyme)
MKRLALLALVAAACSGREEPAARGAWPGWSPSPRTQVVLLGTGTPNAEPERSGPATAVVVDGVPYLVDCGPGVVRRAAAAGLDVARLARVFVTHLHTDHTVGMADLVLTPWVLERAVPLEVYGPRGVEKMAEHLLQAYQADIRIRIDGLEPANPTGYRVQTHEIEDGVVYRDERVTVKAFPVDHGSWKQAFGFRFETPDRTIVLSGDTRPTPRLIEAARGADLLIHEVYSHARFQKRSPIWQRYHSRSHTSTLELGEIARQVRPRLLVLNHQLFWGATDEDLLREIASVYDGPVVSGRDLDRF